MRNANPQSPRSRCVSTYVAVGSTNESKAGTSQGLEAWQTLGVFGIRLAGVLAGRPNGGSRGRCFCSEAS